MCDPTLPGGGLTFTTADQYRNAIVKHYSEELDLARTWNPHANPPGNPTCSDQFRRFLKGLKKHRIESGEYADRSLPMTGENMRTLHEFIPRSGGSVEERIHRGAITKLAHLLWTRMEELTSIREEHLEWDCRHLVPQGYSHG
ncbi:hypothetical protein BCR33DRAFT_718165 [Rhizoclosmatium globosum]|uniref:Uncharacterized protein n=1 Tax=Rhizoclosmatium globosum TaxID=329046 RepID=A0A1Y2C6B4_9FUNG|nr:hypothetical protein BCR33DRAFT_718165 [Rhizoclosmatium globosum]|eukprot:ORY42476.1 hypothetical protein BCR33DRAFT_718165 [Rhizoclosmatium globosum]